MNLKPHELFGEIEFMNKSGEYPLVYIRKDAKSQIKIILNPTGKEYVFPYNNENVLYKNNVNVKNQIHLGCKSFVFLLKQ